ncbi:MAG TPA: FtsX-like permease family protein [Pseudorhodoplanes sp.]|nr:FtsX-like permease family protein [Pseudorhodoplanes sp.]
MNAHSGSAPMAASPPSWTLPLRFALRELRGGIRGFYVFIGCIALGVMAIAGIGSIAESLTGGLAREGRTILGGDVAFSLSQREIGEREGAFLAAYGTVSRAATLRAMARAAGGGSTLVELKAVDGAYPLYGTLSTEPSIALDQALAERDGAFGAVADPALLSRLDLRPGSRIDIGAARIEIRAGIVSEPDRLAGGIGFGPRLLISVAALHATGLVQPGSLVRWHYRVRLAGGGAGDGAVAAFVSEAERRWPEAGWEIRSRGNATPQLERNVERFTQYLTLVGLTALLVGGAGIANAVTSHIGRKRGTIATMKSFGATGYRVFAIYLTQVLLLAGIGAAIGLALGAALPFAVNHLFGRVLPLPIDPALKPGQLGFALLYGMLTALAFALWPLGRTHDIPASVLFRDDVDGAQRRPRLPYLLAAALATAALLTATIVLAYDRKIAAIFVAAAAATFVSLRLIALLIMGAARRLPHSRLAPVRLAVANIHRPGALTPTIVLSLGLGIALLVTIIEIDGNLRRQFAEALPEKAPSFFFVDIQSGEVDRLEHYLRAQVPGARIERVPMLRGRIVSARGVRADELKSSPDAAWALQGDRGITYASEIPDGSRVVAGEWWKADYSGPPLLSIEKKIAEGLGLGLGDEMTVNVLGRNVTATIANLRSVDWQSLGINFVLVFSPDTFRGAPHTYIATLAYPGSATASQEASLLKSVADAFPAVTSVRVKDALDSVAGIVANLIQAVRGASLITLLAAMAVLAGALAASHHHRVYDAVILKTLGATQRQLLTAYVVEYALLGAATATFGVAAGSAAGWLVVAQVMNLRYVWLIEPALITTLAAVAVTIAFGLVGTFGALNRKPGPVLRNL